MDPVALKEITARAINPLAPRYRAGAPVDDSEDLRRVVTIPRRKMDLSDPLAAQLWTQHLRRERTTPCDCANKYPGGCITDLRPVQGWALENAMDARGLVASIGVGDGKTGIDILLPMAIPGVRVAVLLLPANLKPQFLIRDYPQWSEHFKVPNLAGGTGFIDGRPMLHLISYHDLSNPKNSDLFKRISPDLIIADEAHNLKDPTTARTGRFLRLYAEKPTAMFAGLSGTLTTKSIRDYAHLSALALRDSSPLPVHPPTVDEWATALDAESSLNPYPSRPGALLRLCGPEEQAIADDQEKARAGFRRRLHETLGVVATKESDLRVALILRERKPPPTPQNVLDAIAFVRANEERPDGEQLQNQLEVSAVTKRLAAGFYYRWRFPKVVNGHCASHDRFTLECKACEDLRKEVIERWRSKRKLWRKEVRDALKHPVENLDSPSLLEHAAERWLDGYQVNDHGHISTFPPFTRNGPKMVFPSAFLNGWREVRHTVEPVTEAVWESHWLAADSAQWAAENVGIIWVQHDAFARAVLQEAKKIGLKLPYYGGGPQASIEIAAEKGDRPIMASIKAHGTGKNLQMFSRNLVANPPSDSAAWEQMIGRTHRTNQKADEVVIEVYRHLPEFREAIEQAQARARYVEQTTGSKQRLAVASIEWEQRGPLKKWDPKKDLVDTVDDSE